ncbi:MAG: tetratricopeptide repeat protein [Candidatus Obscuribacterales bacterium]|nr:tetratricopeptide repeat protein [Candidatus Obscuribacterales bacterium]
MESLKQLDFDHAALARTYLSEGRLEEAEKLYQTALSVAEQVHGAQSQEAVSPLTNLADFYFERADFAKARVYLERLFALLNTQDRLVYARTGGQLASCLEWCGENDQAEKVLLATIRSAEKGLGCEHEVTQTLLLELGNHYVRVGVYVAARAVFEELVELFTTLWGADAAALIDVYAKLADVYDKMNLYQDRIATLEKQLALQEKSEQRAISLASTLGSLGDAYGAAASYFRDRSLAQKALQSFERALSIYENQGSLPSAQILKQRMQRLTA